MDTPGPVTPGDDRPAGPARIPGYRDFERIGAGGFATVYKARQDAFDRIVAVKILGVELVDEAAQRRFQRECRTHGRLSSHPNIVTVLDSGFTAEGLPFITSEYMPQGSLADRLASTGPLPVNEVLDIGVKLCSALAAVHDAGILHRDIKPENVLVSEYGEPELADFGISTISLGPEATAATASLTPLHTAPEVLHGQPASQASDLYALGSTLYMLLAGRAPFQGENDEGIIPLLRRIIEEPVPEIGRADLPGPVMDLVRYTLAKDPAARYPTAASLGEAIQATQRHLQWPVTPLRLPGRGTLTGDDAATPTPTPTPAFSATPTGPPPAVTTPPPGSGTPPPAATSPPPDATSPPAGAAVGGSSSKAGLLVGLGILLVVALVAVGVLVTRGGDDVAAPDTTDPGAATTSTAGDTSTTSTTPPPDPLRFDVTGPRLDTETLPSPGGVLRVALDSGPRGWDPETTPFAAGARLVALTILEPLAVMGDDGPEPYLAEGITANDDHTVWTITLPEGVTFHDGTPLDADIVARNLTAYRASPLLASFLGPVAAIEATDARTVVVTMADAWVTFPVMLTTQAGWIISASMLDDPTGAEAPVGTGPFAYRDRGEGTLTVDRNVDYRIEGQPVLEGIEFQRVIDASERRRLLESGKVDVLYTTDPEALAELAGQPTLSVTSEYQMGVVLNTAAAPFDDVRVRRALAAGVDRNQVNEVAFGGDGRVSTTAFPSASPWASDETSGQYTNTTTARELLDEYGQPVSFRLLTRNQNRQKEVADDLARQWAALGVTVEVVAVDEETYDQAVVDDDYDAVLWRMAVPTDPDEWVPWFYSSGPPSGGFDWNVSRFADPETDAVFRTGRTTSDLDERRRAYANLDERLTDEVPLVWLTELPSALVATDRVVGWDLAATGGLGRGGVPWANRIGFE